MHALLSPIYNTKPPLKLRRYGGIEICVGLYYYNYLTAILKIYWVKQVS